MLKTCPWCKNEFNAYRRSMKFCSQPCAVHGRTGPTRKSRSSLVNVQCAHCGRALRRKPHVAKKWPRHFCDLGCKNGYQVGQFAGKGNPNYKAAGEKRCQHCNKVYQSYNKESRYCSSRCSYRHAPTESKMNYRRGYEAEHKCKARLEKEGYHVTRASSSKGKFDIIATRADSALFIQVKRTKAKGRRKQPNGRRELLSVDIPDDPRLLKQLWTWVDKCGWYIATVKPDGAVEVLEDATQ